MEIVEKQNNNLHLILKELIVRKSQRDRQSVSICQLAKAINMPHSMLVKLMHINPTKRVNNPRIDMLIKVVDFFRQDGFDITIDQLIAGCKAHSNTIELAQQDVDILSAPQSIPIYSMTAGLQNTIGTIDVTLSTDSSNAIALLSDEDIKPMFKKGSVFIVNPSLTPENNTLVAAKAETCDKILIRKFYAEEHRNVLKSHDNHIPPIELTSASDYQILGVVIQVNATPQAE